MKKKFLALVLTLTMVLSLVPVTALAADTPAGGASQGNTDNLTMKKTVTPVQNQDGTYQDGTYQDGTYTVRLESYATGEVIPTQAPVPMDFVLVLDVSGSMDGENGQIASYGYQKTKRTSWYAKNVYYATTTYYAKIGEEYYPVSCQRERVPNEYIGGHYEYWLEANGRPLGNKGKWGEQLYSGSLYTYGEVPDSRMSKLKAMQTAVNHFIDSVAAQKNGDDSVAHRISIVKFAGTSIDEVGNDTYTEGWNTYNYTQKVKELTDVTVEGNVDSLKTAVNALNAGGATRADLGMEKADGVLNGRQDAEKDRPSVVIMFTDGVPTKNTNFNWNVAGAAVDTAKTLKAGETKVYTIGMFTDADPSDTRGAFNKYMNGVSSKYPNASGTKDSWGEYTDIDLGDPADGNYYFKADNAGDLDQVFQTISESTTVTSPLDASAVVVDNVPSNFALTEGSVKVYTADCTGKTGEELNWGEATPATPAQGISSTSTKNDDGSQTISATGFNFSENWCGVDGDKYRGQKLIIEFTIKCTNYGGTQPTNAGAYIKAKEADEKPIIKLNDPTVPVTISLGSNEELLKNPEVQDEKTYDGTGLAILPKIAEKANALATGTDNAYVNMDLTVMVGKTTYTYKILPGATTGSWYEGDSADQDPMTPEQIADVTTPKDVNRDQESNEVEPYTYTFDLKLSDANPKGAESGAESKEYKDNNASFKITPRNVTLTSATDSKEYDGNPLTNNKITEGGDGFVKGEGATYTVTGSQTGVGESANKFTYTLKDGTTASNYNITTKFGKLTITKKEEVSYTVIFDANGGAWDDGNETVTQPYESSSSLVSRPTNDPKKSGSTFVDWAYKDAGGTFQSIGQNPFMGIRVSTLQQLSGVTGNSVTLYAVWKDNDTAPTGSLNYRINQYFIDETGKVANSISKPGRNTVDTAISTLISDLIPQDRSFPNYQYEEAKTTVNDKKYNGNEKLAQDDTVINLYYYLDSWEDGDRDPDNTTDDSLTDGDDIPDCKQILIQYQVYQEGNGQVSPTFEVVTVNDNGTKTEIKGSTATATPKYVFVTWTKGKVTDKNVGELATTISTEKHCTPVPGELEVGQPYTYTAIFLEDKVGKKDKDGNDTGDGIPDAWQYKVTFKVANGKWNDQTSADVVAYVTNKDKDGNPCAKGTEGSKATLDGVTIPVAGSQPDSGYRASGNWNTKPSTDLEIKEDTVFIYTYDQKSGGSGGSGGSHKPTVTIPDDVPTGLNGKDHYAYVVGYPDGMVYPQKNITRAEVATIFFRLLKDETREANMTKSNGYNDMKDGAWYTCAVSTLSKMGIIKGYEDGSFKPDASISRAEFAAIAARFDPDGDKTPATFSDVSSHWAKDEISIAANHGWIKGYEDGSFKPDQKITRAETMTLVNRVLKRLPETKDDLHKDMKTWPDNQNESAWFYLAVQEATNSHYQNLKKDGTHEKWESMRETRDWAALEK